LCVECELAELGDEATGCRALSPRRSAVQNECVPSTSNDAEKAAEVDDNVSA